jgi:hypothetical protein
MSRLSLTLLRASAYVGANHDDPIRFYAVPGAGWFHRSRNADSVTPWRALIVPYHLVSQGA